jgi:low affinity Fe/Cu permease
VRDHADPQTEIRRRRKNSMGKKRKSRFREKFESFSRRVTSATGKPWAFGIAPGTILVWGVTGPIFGFSDTWQLVINTGTTIVTFLMVFLIQQSQNKDTQAIELKLNELVAAVEGASNRLIDIESLSEDDLETLHGFYRKLAAMAKGDRNITQSHSVEEAEARHRTKHGKTRRA